MTKDKLVWYASYGSNCFRERFHCYIRGGRYKGNATEHKGCRDQRLPFDEKNIIINHKLYFAKRSKSWDSGGVGFIGLDKDEKERTFGKMYLVTQEQFSDIVKQETKCTEDIEIDFDRAKKAGYIEVLSNAWYGNVLYLGSERGYPIFTFTNSANLTEYNKPSESYLETIVKGVITNYSLSPDEIQFYLLSRPGIINNYNKQELEEIIVKCIDEKNTMTGTSVLTGRS
jgi:hypothetical protein